MTFSISSLCPSLIIFCMWLGIQLVLIWWHGTQISQHYVFYFLEAVFILGTKIVVIMLLVTLSRIKMSDKLVLWLLLCTETHYI